ncbi:MAG: PqiC family protein [Puniceicoccales bacterium]|jgi:uncharacterized lipoprotein YmbA|nr:PqiC family protein [Puniceicoccales bacterium]
MKNHFFLFVFTAAFLLSGCSVLDPKKDPAVYYVLNTTETPQLPPAAKRPELALSVARVQLPAYLDRMEVVSRPAENRLEASGTHLWMEPLGKACTRVFSQDLAQRLGTGRLAIAPSLDIYSDALQVQVEIIRFDGEPGVEVKLRARWRLAWLATGKTLLTGEHAFAVPLTSKTDYEDYAGGMSKALNLLAEAVAQEIRKINLPAS